MWFLLFCHTKLYIQLMIKIKIFNEKYTFLLINNINNILETFKNLENLFLKITILNIKPLSSCFYV
jgi:hypothetical protein